MKQVTDTYKFRKFIEEMNDITPKTNHSRSYEVSDSFCKSTWDNSLKLARYGIKNQTNIEKIMASMSLLEHVKTKCFNMAETGLCVDVGAYLNGVPECFISEDFDYQPKKVVKLLISIGCAWYFNSNQIENRGAGIMSLIQMLKKQGYIVKINLYESSYVSEYDTKYTCFIKIPSNPLDIQSLSYALCDTSLLRRFLFAWMEHKQKRPHCGGYGRPERLSEASVSKDIIHFNGLGSEECNYENEQETKEHILKIFNKFLDLNNEKRVKE